MNDGDEKRLKICSFFYFTIHSARYTKHFYTNYELNSPTLTECKTELMLAQKKKSSIRRKKNDEMKQQMRKWKKNKQGRCTRSRKTANIS